MGKGFVIQLVQDRTLYSGPEGEALTHWSPAETWSLAVGAGAVQARVELLARSPSASLRVVGQWSLDRKTWRDFERELTPAAGLTTVGTSHHYYAGGVHGYEFAPYVRFGVVVSDTGGGGTLQSVQCGVHVLTPGVSRPPASASVVARVREPRASQRGGLLQRLEGHVHSVPERTPVTLVDGAMLQSASSSATAKRSAAVFGPEARAAAVELASHLGPELLRPLAPVAAPQYDELPFSGMLLQLPVVPGPGPLGLKLHPLGMPTSAFLVGPRHVLTASHSLVWPPHDVLFDLLHARGLDAPGSADDATLPHAVLYVALDSGGDVLGVAVGQQVWTLLRVGGKTLSPVQAAFDYAVVELSAPLGGSGDVLPVVEYPGSAFDGVGGLDMWTAVGFDPSTAPPLAVPLAQYGFWLGSASKDFFLPAKYWGQTIHGQLLMLSPSVFTEDTVAAGASGGPVWANTPGGSAAAAVVSSAKLLPIFTGAYKSAVLGGGGAALTGLVDLALTSS